MGPSSRDVFLKRHVPDSCSWIPEAVTPNLLRNKLRTIRDKPMYLVGCNRNEGARAIKSGQVVILPGCGRAEIDTVNTRGVQRLFLVSYNRAIVSGTSVPVGIDSLEIESAWGSGLQLREARDGPVATNRAEHRICRAVIGPK